MDSRPTRHFRLHRSTLDESMQTMITIVDRQGIVERVNEVVLRPVTADDVDVALYLGEPDPRCGWAETWIVTLRDWGPVGFTDGPVVP